MQTFAFIAYKINDEPQLGFARLLPKLTTKRKRRQQFIWYERNNNLEFIASSYYNIAERVPFYY